MGCGSNERCVKVRLVCINQQPPLLEADGVISSASNTSDKVQPHSSFYILNLHTSTAYTGGHEDQGIQLNAGRLCLQVFIF